MIQLSYTLSPDSHVLILHADAEARAMIAELREEKDPAYPGFSTSDELEALDHLTSSSELEWINPVQTGDLTEAPLLGIFDADGNVVQRWGYEPYAVRSFLDDLLNTGEAKFSDIW